MIRTETYRTMYEIYMSIEGENALSFEDFLNKEKEKRAKLLGNKSILQV